jgi:hypothetical protein
VSIFLLLDVPENLELVNLESVFWLLQTFCGGSRNPGIGVLIVE